MRSIIVVAATCVLLAMGVACEEEEEEWRDTVSTLDLTYEVTAGEPQDFLLTVELDSGDRSICDRLYLAFDAVPLAAAPEASLGVIHGTNVDMVVLGLEQGEKVRLGDTVNSADRVGGGCIAEHLVRVATNAPVDTVELRVDIFGSEGGPAGHPGAAAFTVEVTDL